MDAYYYLKDKIRQAFFNYFLKTYSMFSPLEASKSLLIHISRAEKLRKEMGGQINHPNALYKQMQLFLTLHLFA